MTKYDELTALAQAYSQQYFEQRNNAGEDVITLVRLFLEFLNSPQINVSLMSVDSNFKPIGEERTSWEGQYMSELTEGFWGCVVAIKYGAHPAAGWVKFWSRLSVKRRGGLLLIRLGYEGAVHQVKLGAPENFKDFLEHWFLATKGDLERGVSGQSRSIGFVTQE